MFDIAKEIASITEEYCRVNGINTEHPPVVFDKESLLYQSLLRVNQPDFDKHEYDNEPEVIYTNHGNGPDWEMP
jgi:hypothetical protein